jgi:hypothetical protein
MSDNNNFGDTDVNINVTEMINENDLHVIDNEEPSQSDADAEPEHELSVSEPELEVDPDSQYDNIEINIDSTRTGYNYDIVLTYKMIDDDDDQETLFRLQFLQAFGITSNEYQPDVVSAELDVLYSKFHDNPSIQKILQSHPLYNKEVRGSNTSPDNDNDNDNDKDKDNDNTDGGSAIVMSTDNGEMIFCMMFSFQTFDLFHKCLQNAHYGREISSELVDQLTVLHKNMF